MFRDPIWSSEATDSWLKNFVISLGHLKGRKLYLETDLTELVWMK